MRRLSCRVVLACTVSILATAPSAVAQYGRYDDRYGDEPAAIALFSDEDFYGEVRDIFDPFASMRDLGFNDRARSVAVFAGQWELCEHKNFTGRCVFIKEDVADLGWFGLAGRVSSVRPIYEYTEAHHGLLFSRDRYGYIRYAHNETYGYDSWTYGYASSWGLGLLHYGYSPEYRRYGYYSPSWGYDPYGFAWGPRGTVRYTTTYWRHPRPSVINPYWIGWDFHQPDWRRGHWSWRDGRRGHDDWRRDRRGDDDDHWRRGSDVVADPVPDDPRPGRGWRDDRRGSDTGLGVFPDPSTGVAVIDTPTDIPRDPRPGRGGRGNDDDLLGGGGSDGGWRDDRPGRGGDGGGRGRRSDDDGAGRFGGGMTGGGIWGTDGGSDVGRIVSPPPPPPPAPDVIEPQPDFRSDPDRPRGGEFQTQGRNKD